MKKIVRIYKQDMAVADVIMLEHERIDPAKPLTIFDPVETWKRLTLTDYTVRDMLLPIFRDGELVYKAPDLMAIQQYCFREMRTLWDQYKRLRNPHVYKVDFSKELYALRHSLLVPGASEPDVPDMQDDRRIASDTNL